MSEQLTGQCNLVTVDSRELYWLRALRLGLEVQGDPTSDYVKRCLQKLKPWEDAPIPEEWK